MCGTVTDHEWDDLTDRLPGEMDAPAFIIPEALAIEVPETYHQRTESHQTDDDPVTVPSGAVSG